MDAVPCLLSLTGSGVNNPTLLTYTNKHTHTHTHTPHSPSCQAGALHGEQYLQLLAPLPAEGGQLVSRPELVDMQAKGGWP